ncbi:MAG TPA: dTDP-4-amino-4,6-dideoxygalactose transaminase, partial [Bacteroidetes bacterium]|nr:dTDP-4-amino-4,6-dideoxygalactose transaminase [Bacteroidota bacterium]
MIPFNKPYLTGKEAHYMYQAVYNGHISGNGQFTKKCQKIFEEKYGFKKCLLTTSCTDALEMAAILIDTKAGDEIIIPSFTFVSTANAFVLRGAKIVFADSCPNNPNIDAQKIESLITEKTKAIVPVHYAGVACDMEKIMSIAQKHKLFVIEDAAQAIDSRYKDKHLGTIGHLSAFSFHETKNIQSGEGGMLAINDQQFIKRAEIIWEKGTNRAEFFRGEVNKYGWIDIGSSFLPSDIIGAFLFAQLENLENIQERRKKIWQHYYDNLKHLEKKKHIKLPFLPEYATNNAHLFYILCNSAEQRSMLITHLKKNKISSVFHYLPLHLSEFYKNKHDGRMLPNSIKFSEKILRLPM